MVGRVSKPVFNAFVHSFLTEDTFLLYTSFAVFAIDHCAY